MGGQRESSVDSHEQGSDDTVAARLACHRRVPAAARVWCRCRPGSWRPPIEDSRYHLWQEVQARREIAREQLGSSLGRTRAAGPRRRSAPPLRVAGPASAGFLSSPSSPAGDRGRRARRTSRAPAWGSHPPSSERRTPSRSARNGNLRPVPGRVGRCRRVDLEPELDCRPSAVARARHGSGHRWLCGRRDQPRAATSVR